MKNNSGTTPVDQAVQKSLLAHLRSTFLRGVGVIIPLVLTYWVFGSLLTWVDGILSPLLTNLIGQKIPGLGFMAMLVLIMLVGLLTRNLLGTLLLAWFEDLLRSIPFVRSVYGAIKDLVSSFATGGKGQTFRKVILTEYPRPGIYVIGFVTNEMTYTAPDGRRLEFYNVYIPSPPNPTAGFLSLVPKEEAVILNLTVEEGLKLVLSGGIIVPGELTSRSATESEHSLGTTAAG
jgi:uncharacterized membrane protein